MCPYASWFFSFINPSWCSSIPEHKELSLSFWQRRNLCCGGNVRLYLSNPLLMACFQSFVTISRASVTIFAIDFTGCMDKFWCRWNSWRRNSWVKGFVQKVPKKNGGKWVTGEATCPRSQLISGGAVSLGSLVLECRLLTLHCGSLRPFIFPFETNPKL